MSAPAPSPDSMNESDLALIVLDRNLSAQASNDPAVNLAWNLVRKEVGSMKRKRADATGHDQGNEHISQSRARQLELDNVRLQAELEAVTEERDYLRRRFVDHAGPIAALLAEPSLKRLFPAGALDQLHVSTALNDQTSRTKILELVLALSSVPFSVPSTCHPPMMPDIGSRYRSDLSRSGHAVSSMSAPLVLNSYALPPVESLKSILDCTINVFVPGTLAPLAQPLKEVAENFAKWKITTNSPAENVDGNGNDDDDEPPFPAVEIWTTEATQAVLATIAVLSHLSTQGEGVSLDRQSRRVVTPSNPPTRPRRTTYALTSTIAERPPAELTAVTILGLKEAGSKVKTAVEGGRYGAVANVVGMFHIDGQLGDGVMVVMAPEEGADGTGAALEEQMPGRIVFFGICGRSQAVELLQSFAEAAFPFVPRWEIRILGNEIPHSTQKSDPVNVFVRLLTFYRLTMVKDPSTEIDAILADYQLLYDRTRDNRNHWEVVRAELQQWCLALMEQAGVWGQACEKALTRGVS